METLVAGLDEVGRGCWAGPLVAAAVVLNIPIEGLRDSKKLSAKKRQALSDQILLTASCGIGWVSPAEVDSLGLTAAVGLAMQRAIEQIAGKYQNIIIDGDYNFLPDYKNVQTLVRADDTVPAVSAASIIAKVARDQYMTDANAQYPGYGFASHVGYGTKQHIEALKDLGLTPLHRRSYKPIKAYL